jgi:hypothetical protein
MAALALFLSISPASGACELSCTLSQLGAPGARSATAATEIASSNQPLQEKEQAVPSHCQHAGQSRGSKLMAIASSSHMASCRHRQCNQPAASDLQQIIRKVPIAVRMSSSVFDRIQENHIFAALLHCPFDDLAPALSALSPPLISLRI